MDSSYNAVRRTVKAYFGNNRRLAETRRTRPRLEYIQQLIKDRRCDSRVRLKRNVQMSGKRAHINLQMETVVRDCVSRSRDTRKQR